MRVHLYIVAPSRLLFLDETTTKTGSSQWPPHPTLHKCRPSHAWSRPWARRAELRRRRRRRAAAVVGRRRRRRRRRRRAARDNPAEILVLPRTADGGRANCAVSGCDQKAVTVTAFFTLSGVWRLFNFKGGTGRNIAAEATSAASSVSNDSVDRTAAPDVNRCVFVKSPQTQLVWDHGEVGCRH